MIGIKKEIFKRAAICSVYGLYLQLISTMRAVVTEIRFLLFVSTTTLCTNTHNGDF